MANDGDIHVLHVVPGLMPGGMELTLARLLSGLAGNGMRHSIVCLKGEPEIQALLPAGVAVHCLHSRPNEPQLPLRLARLIRQTRPDVIHARNWGAWPDVAVARWLASPVPPLVFSFHGLGKAGYMPRRRRWASWALCRMTPHLLTVSAQSRRMLVEHWGWPANRVAVMPNGVDTHRFAPRPRLPAAGPLIVGTVGNLRPVKNHALLVRACAALVAEGIDLHLRIAGQGPLRDDLLAQARQAGLGDRLSLPGRVEDVPAFLNEVDVFVLSSDSEQHPNALNEAMACGLACVSTRVGCAEELLDDQRCGLLIEPGDADALSAAIRRFRDDEPLRRRMGQAARQRVLDHYSLGRMIEDYQRLYLHAARR